MLLTGYAHVPAAHVPGSEENVTKWRFLRRLHCRAPFFFLSFSPLPFLFGFRGQRGSIWVLNYNAGTILEKKMLTENLNPFLLLFGTVCIPTSKSTWMQLQSQIKWYQKRSSFKIVDLCGRLFNLSPAICDTITLIYVWAAFWDFIYQRNCVFWNLILMKYLTSWMG